LGRSSDLVRKLLTFAAAALLTLRPFPMAARPPNKETHNLKEGHKQQRKSLKQQQRAEKQALEQHPQTPESRKRFKHDMKEQRRMVKQVQKTETRQLKEGRRASKQATGASKHRESRGGYPETGR